MAFVVLTGLAGSGKTDLLVRLAADGEQVIDLEGLAAHRGSAFGRIGITRPQPTSAEFSQAVQEKLARYDPTRPIWVEDEGPYIGAVSLPSWLLAALQCSEVLPISVAREQRLQRVFATYSVAGPEPLIAGTLRSRRRLGPDRTRQVVTLLQADRLEPAIDILLDYFDQAYRRHRRQASRPRDARPTSGLTMA